MSWKYAALTLLKVTGESKLKPVVYRIGPEVSAAAGPGTFHPDIPEELKAEVLQLVQDIVAGKVGTVTERWCVGLPRPVKTQPGHFYGRLNGGSG